MRPISRLLARKFIFAGLGILVGTTGGCVSKAKAKADAQAAFQAGQQQALVQMQRQQMQGQVVRINGPVRQPIIPWTERMTVSTALVAADYYGPDPTAIFIARAGRAIQVDPRKLLEGHDLQLLAGDVIEVQTGGRQAPSEQQ